MVKAAWCIPLLAGCGIPTPTTPPTNFIIGDSIVMLWDQLPSVWDNYGVSGDMTGNVVARLDPIVEKSPDRVIVAVGINDLKNDPSPQAYTTFQINYQNIINRLITDTAADVYIFSLLPTGDSAWNARVNTANAWLKSIARGRVSYINTHDAFPSLAAAPLFKDALHPADAGYDILVRFLPPII